MACAYLGLHLCTTLVLPASLKVKPGSHAMLALEGYQQCQSVQVLDSRNSCQVTDVAHALCCLHGLAND